MGYKRIQTKKEWKQFFDQLCKQGSIKDDKIKVMQHYQKFKQGSENKQARQKF